MLASKLVLASLRWRIAGATRRPVEFGRSYVVRPKGRHQATIVWLHGLGDTGARYVFENLISAALMFSPRVKTKDWIQNTHKQIS